MFISPFCLPITCKTLYVNEFGVQFRKVILAIFCFPGSRKGSLRCIDWVNLETMIAQPSLCARDFGRKLQKGCAACSLGTTDLTKPLRRSLRRGVAITIVHRCLARCVLNSAHVSIAYQGAEISPRILILRGYPVTVSRCVLMPHPDSLTLRIREKIDFFLSHSWYDDPTEKLAKLAQVLSPDPS